jgi:hypothetical protein
MANADHVKAMIRRTPESQARHNAQLQDYLLRRGQDLAAGMELGQPTDLELIELARLDAIAQHPDIAQDLAPVMAMLQDQNQHERRVLAQAQGWYLTANPARITGGPGTDPGSEPRDPDRPSSESSDDGDHQRRGQVDSHARGGPESLDRNGNFDEVAWYLRNVPDPDDEKWTPS